MHFAPININIWQLETVLKKIICLTIIEGIMVYRKVANKSTSLLVSSASQKVQNLKVARNFDLV